MTSAAMKRSARTGVVVLDETLESPAEHKAELGHLNGDEERRAKATRYRVVSISLYHQDIQRLEAMVNELRRRGHTRASKSQLIRFALDTVRLDDLPRGY